MAVLCPRKSEDESLRQRSSRRGHSLAQTPQFTHIRGIRSLFLLDTGRLSSLRSTEHREKGGMLVWHGVAGGNGGGPIGPAGISCLVPTTTYRCVLNDRHSSLVNICSHHFSQNANVDFSKPSQNTHKRFCHLLNS